MKVEASVVIASWHDHDMLKACLSSIREDRSFVGEIIVVDDCASDVTQAMAGELGYIYYRTTGNCGPATGWNVGVSFAQYDRVIVLNSDTEVYDGFFQDYCFHYAKIGHDCILGPSGNIINQRLKIEVLDHTLKEEDYHHIPVDYVGGFCMMFNRKQTLRLGVLFDQAYRLYYEDTDFCTHAAQKGIPSYFLNPKLLPITHHGSGATSKLKDAQFFMYESRRYFVSKWRKYYRRRDPRGVEFIRC